MLTMTYTNTLLREKQCLTEKVCVSTSELGKELVERWNVLAEPFGHFHYAILCLEPASIEEQDTLGTYHTKAQYQKAKKK